MKKAPAAKVMVLAGEVAVDPLKVPLPQLKPPVDKVMLKLPCVKVPAYPLVLVIPVILIAPDKLQLTLDDPPLKIATSFTPGTVLVDQLAAVLQDVLPVDIHVIFAA
jgi:hypothetical protein